MTPVEIAARSALVVHLSPAPRSRELPAALSAQTVPLSALAQVIVTHEDLTPGEQDGLREQLGCAQLRFVRVDPALPSFDVQYMGFFAVDARRCDWVVFGHSDCLPGPHWLHALLQPFGRRHPPAAVAGRTSYDLHLAGLAQTALDFHFPPAPHRCGDVRTLDAHNMALRCDSFGRFARQAQAGVEGSQGRLLGLALVEAGLRIQEAPQAHAIQRRTPGLAGVLSERWRQGRIAAGVAPHLLRARLPVPLQGLARSGPLGPLALTALRTLAALRALNHQSLPRVRGLRRLAAWACILGAALVTSVSAVAHGFRGLGAPTARGLRPAKALHTDFANSRLW
ncbi:MAG: glycosyltransferase family 2 protein [Pseudomonadota bacterium]